MPANGDRRGYLASRKGVRGNALGCAFLSIAGHVVAIEREGGIGDLIPWLHAFVELFHCQLSRIRLVCVDDAVRAGSTRNGENAASRLSRPVSDKVVGREATGLALKTAHHFGGPIFVKIAVSVVSRQPVRSVGRDALLIRAVGGNQIAITPRCVFLDVLRPGNSRFAVCHPGTIDGVVNGRDGIPAIGGFADFQVLPRKHFPLHPVTRLVVGPVREPSLHVNRNIGQVCLVEAEGQVTPGLLSADVDGVLDSEVEGAVLANRVGHAPFGFRANGHIVERGRDLSTRLVPLRIARIGVIGAVGKPRVGVVETLHCIFGRPDVATCVVHDFFAVAIVAGKVSDSCRAVVVVDALPRVALVSDDLLQRSARMHAVGVHHQIAVGVVLVHLTPQREKDVGALFQYLVDVAVVPGGEEGNVLRLGALVVIRSRDRVGIMPLRSVVARIAGSR